MSGALTALLDGALQSLDHAIESTSGERQTPAELTALAGRVERALTAQGVARAEPVLLRMGNRPCRYRRAARRLAGGRGRRAAACHRRAGNL